MNALLCGTFHRCANNGADDKNRKGNRSTLTMEVFFGNFATLHDDTLHDDNKRFGSCDKTTVSQTEFRGFVNLSVFCNDY